MCNVQPLLSLQLTCSLIVFTFNCNLQEELDLDDKADNVFKEWLDKNIEFNNYLTKDDKGNTATPITVTNGQVDLVNLIHSFDTLRYFDESGIEEFPSITLLARVHLSKMDNGGEQERLYSTAWNAQGNKQARIYHDKLEKRTLLAHNKKFRKKYGLC